MYRLRLIVQVRYGDFKEYMEASQQLNELARSKGWAEATFWSPTVGASNEFIAEIDFPDLATFERESEAGGSDPEARKLILSMAPMVIEGSARSELLETAPTLA